ncbi:sulfite exporter TauE/SafE family protein [Maridesulfovibrio sp. FT414]|uniref:sulfite exporter TauE/SafE family protein n=1 Tax=Maridesulfovibrio sp. FT414 TaxID=2979469 RepID=UPI003D8078EF
MSAFILLPAIFFSAGFLQGLTGFGSALIAMPLLAYVVDIKTAVAVCTLCGVTINLRMCSNLRSKLDRKKVLPLIIGSIPGAVFGTVVLKEVDGQMIKLFLGLLVSGYASYSLLVKPLALKISPVWGYVSGFMTGAITASVSAGGPPTIIYSSLMGWKKDDFKATLAGFFLVAASMGALGHLLSGLTTLYAFKLFLVSLVPVQLGVLFGHRLSSRVAEGLYRRIVMVLLVFMGLMLIFQNV